MLDLGIENDMKQLFLQPLVNEVPDEVRGMLDHPRTLATFTASTASSLMCARTSSKNSTVTR